MIELGVKFNKDRLAEIQQRNERVNAAVGAPPLQASRASVRPRPAWMMREISALALSSPPPPPQHHNIQPIDQLKQEIAAGTTST